jgi:hypothetical protein
MITPKFVKMLIESKGHTQTSAARSLGVTDRTVRRWCREWPGWRAPPMIALVALKSMSKKRGPR